MDFAPQGHLTISGNIFTCHKREEVLLASSGEKHPVQDVNSAEAGNPCSKMSSSMATGALSVLLTADV